MSNGTGPGDWTTDWAAGEDVLRTIEVEGLPPGVRVEEAAGAVLCALVEELDEPDALVVLQLVPESVQRWVRRDRVQTDLVPAPSREEFLRAVQALLPGVPAGHAERITYAVFRSLRRHLSPSENEQIERMLIDEVGDLWRAAGA